MRLILGLVLGGSMAWAAVASAAPAGPDVTGRWQTPTRHGIVEVTRCGGSICGRLVESDAIRANADARDTHNKDEAQRGRRLKGLLMLGGFTADENAWTGGSVYNGEDGGTYHATVTPVDQDHIKVKGCIIWPLCKSQTWIRLR